jgi:hypothetical protein
MLPGFVAILAPRELTQRWQAAVPAAAAIALPAASSGRSLRRALSRSSQARPPSV